MLFNSYAFIFIFLPIIWCLYFALEDKRQKLLVLAISSYIFYGYWNYKFIPLLLFSTVIDFYVAKKLGEAQKESRRKSLLIISLIVNLGVLGFFKYFNFFMDSISFIQGDSFIPWQIVLPVGISFYTFQSMSYTIDIYRGHLKPYRDFLAFSTYVSFFPQLIAGPIVRHDELVPQFLKPLNEGRVDWDSVGDGTIRFIIGLAKKVIIADAIGIAIDEALIHLDDFSGLEAWMCAFGYTFQLYFDFSGYSDMAIGLGKMFNFTFPENFNSPYKSRSITDFWRRWHMTLSFWLRDYLYISLGGNRGKNWHIYRNLILTMLLGGLWHGANWVYVIWGAYHGTLLAIERVFRNRVELPLGLKRVVTFFLIVVGWVIFRSPDTDFALIWFEKLFTFEGGLYYKHFLTNLRDKYAVALLMGMIITFFTKNTGQINYAKFYKKRWIVLFSLLIVWVILELGEKSPFLYFQF